METSRRGAMALGMAGVAAPALARPTQRTLILSTWDFGAPANAAAYAQWRKSGSLLDAVEAGARVPEADPENHSVGHAG
ncbi:N(4)-(beta-N-acetylglucosaminyl)-L-asparaginase, partial [Escherichia coli]|nr:N(4)-(beta-N-acetylglucosaminyl)-L-asparaginase [Escherichia coli]